jgi:hypothetical protein
MDSQDAEDEVKETFIEVVNRPHQLRGGQA